MPPPEYLPNSVRGWLPLSEPIANGAGQVDGWMAGRAVTLLLPLLLLAGTAFVISFPARDSDPARERAELERGGRAKCSHPE